MKHNRIVINLNSEGKEVIKIDVPKKLYQELQNLCKINNWDTNKKIINILEDAIFSAEILKDSKGEFEQVINF